VTLSDVPFVVTHQSVLELDVAAKPSRPCSALKHLRQGARTYRRRVLWRTFTSACPTVRVCACAVPSRSSEVTQPTRRCECPPLCHRNATPMFTNLFNGIRAAAESSFGLTNSDVRAFSLLDGSTASHTPTTTLPSHAELPAPPANAMSPQTDDVVPQSPSGPGLPPNPFLEESTPPRKTSRVLIDLSSPPKSSSRTPRKEARSEMARPRQHVTQRSEDEKRLIGDYS